MYGKTGWTLPLPLLLLLACGGDTAGPRPAGSIAASLSHDLTTESGHLLASGQNLVGSITCGGESLGPVTGNPIDHFEPMPVRPDPYDVAVDCSATGADGAAVTAAASVAVPGNEPPAVEIVTDSATYAIGSTARVTANATDPQTDGPLDAVAFCVLTTEQEDRLDDAPPFEWDVEIVRESQEILVTCEDTRTGSASSSRALQSYDLTLSVTYDLETETGRLQASGQNVGTISCQSEVFGNVDGATLDETRPAPVTAEAYSIDAECTVSVNGAILTRSASAVVPANDPPSVTMALDSAEYATGATARVTAVATDPDTDGTRDAVEACVLSTEGFDFRDDAAPFEWNVTVVRSGQEIGVECTDTRGGAGAAQATVAAYPVYALTVGFTELHSEAPVAGVATRLYYSDGSLALEQTVDGELEATLRGGTYRLEWSHDAMIPNLATYLSGTGFQLVNTSDERFEITEQKLEHTGTGPRITLNADVRVDAYLRDSSQVSLDSLNAWLQKGISVGMSHRWEEDWTLRVDTMTQPWTEADKEYIPRLAQIYGECDSLRIVNPVTLHVEYATEAGLPVEVDGAVTAFRDSTQVVDSSVKSAWNPEVLNGSLSFRSEVGYHFVADGLHALGVFGPERELVDGDAAAEIRLSDLGRTLCREIGAEYSGFRLQ